MEIKQMGRPKTISKVQPGYFDIDKEMVWYTKGLEVDDRDYKRQWKERQKRKVIKINS